MAGAVWAQPAGTINAHVHTGRAPAELANWLQHRQARAIDVTVIDPFDRGYETAEPQISDAARVAAASRGRIAWVTTFDPAGFETPGFAERVCRQLQGDFARGAIGVKIYKTMGLSLKDRQGRYVMADHPAFAPIFEFIARHNRTVLAHLAEPASSWRPLDPNEVHYRYYKNNPEWHIYLHPELPSHAGILAARDRVLKAHPKLRMVGAHLGSMEHDVDEIARRLDEYPNFAVDTAARLGNLMTQPKEKVRAFLLKYQDRVLWGTDSGEVDWKDAPAVIGKWQRSWEREWTFYATELGLPREALEKIFGANARRWYPQMK
jgi:predicted TIM-barrel fold metal-dependent hydrolase